MGEAKRRARSIAMSKGMRAKRGREMLDLAVAVPSLHPSILRFSPPLTSQAILSELIMHHFRSECDWRHPNSFFLA